MLDMYSEAKEWNMEFLFFSGEVNKDARRSEVVETTHGKKRWPGRHWDKLCLMSYGKKVAQTTHVKKGWKYGKFNFLYFWPSRYIQTWAVS